MERIEILQRRLKQLEYKFNKGNLSKSQEMKVVNKISQIQIEINKIKRL